ncbi:hypothetical protein NM909_001083 [Staphylococcus pseudintermedius]|uniref:Uncharacterized protein n=1 Tax=Staphylococcus pseudintermedius TaxID=283734 RepID=A0A8H9BXA3_STAPS|nr:hypothetical protein [Staphylococcus pseudintermedius]EGQ2840068.1 hypothetical protein [Staphylococcus pseudintermedius]EGQ3428212.1 hypothetical protein [Staphylococcus pseudintermedius]EGQ3463460.1 hypothetical protein [Staphylococcus pseudintermedius]EGQ4013228.1 hypothetical protein [Staphylococcus pseudintermedius]EGQ4061608.1 hypothetical protein [Staphylococcus pseudintermedius]
MEDLKTTVRSFYRQYKNNKSSSYLLIMMTIVLFYASLFLYVYFKDPTREYSDETKNEIVLRDIKINLVEQKYNPDEELYVLKYKAESADRKSVVLNNQILSVKVWMEKDIQELKNINVYYPLNNFFIIEVKDLPKDYKALKINFNLNDKSGDSNQNTTEVNQYTSAVKEDKDFSLLPKTKAEYFIDAYQYRIKEIEADNKKLRESIKHLEERKQILRDENNALATKDPTLSKEQIENAKQTIEQNKTELTDLSKQIRENENNFKVNLENKQRILTELNKKK